MFTGLHSRVFEMRKSNIIPLLLALAGLNPSTAMVIQLSAVTTEMTGRLDGCATGQTVAQINEWITTIDNNDPVIDDSPAIIGQAMTDRASGAAELASYLPFFDGFKFNTSSYFPGAVFPPADPDAVDFTPLMHLWGMPPVNARPGRPGGNDLLRTPGCRPRAATDIRPSHCG